MERQNRLLAVLSLVLLALVAVVVLDPSPEAPADPDATPETAAFEKLVASDVTGLRLTRTEGKLAFEKKDGVWRVTSPREVPVEERKIQELVDRLVSLKLQTRTLGGDRKDYALDKDSAVQVELHRADGRTETLFVGRDAPVGYDSYVARSADGPVVLANSQLRALVTRGLDDFRDRKLLAVTPSTIQRVVIDDGRDAEIGVRSAELVRRDDGWWVGSTARADEDAVQEWLSRVATVNASRFTDDADLEAVGLARPRASITIEDAGKTHVLRFGAAEGPDVYAQGDGSAAVVEASSLELLKVTDWAASSALPLHRYAIDRVELKLGDEPVSVSKKDGTWTTSSGAAVTDIDRVFDALAAVRAQREGDVSPPDTVAGTVTLGEGDRTLVLELGPADGTVRVARDRAGGAPFKVDAARVDALLQALR